MDVEGLFKSRNNGLINTISVPSFTIEGFLRSANLPEKEKEILVKKYATLFTSPEIGITDENQLSLLTKDFLKEIEIPFAHAAAIVEAAKNYATTVGTIIQKALKGVRTIIGMNSTPPNIHLQERDDQLKKVVSFVGNNLY